METTVLNHKKEAIKTIELPPGIFEAPVSAGFLHEVVQAYRASIRAGTASTKTRTEVSGGGKKPWRQKGTGRARAGSIRSPLWRKGGITFGPKPRSFHVAMPKAKISRGLCQALSDKNKTEKLVCIDLSELFSGDDTPKTKKVARALEQLGAAGKKILYIVDKRDAAFERVSRNIAGFSSIEARMLHAYAVLAADTVLITEPAVRALEERLG